MTSYTRQWLPSQWLDEVVPAPQENPDAFIRPLGGGSFELRAPDEPEEDGFFVAPLVPGQVVEFSAFDDYGMMELTLNEDRTFTTAEPVPAEATHFMMYMEPDTISGSLEELVRNLDEPVDAGPFTVLAYSWAHHTSYRLDVDSDGTARFAMCEGAN